MSSENEEEVVNDNLVRVDFTKGRTRTRSEVPVPTTPAPAGKSVLATKPLVFKSMIADSLVLVRVTTATPGLVLPAVLMGRPTQALSFSHAFRLADFAFDDRGVRASLSFGGTNVFCDVPWSAVFAMISQKNGEHVMWPDSLPATVQGGGS